MLVSEVIMRLYSNVLTNDIAVNRICTENIRAGIQKMAKEYSAEKANFYSNYREFPDYNNVAFRCAYLHKYAPFHTYIVLDTMVRILKEKKELFQEILNSGQLKLCCLGGGPGSDTIAVLIALTVHFKSFRTSVAIIDCMKEWETTFGSLIEELRCGEYGDVSSVLKNSNNFEWSYLGANLLDNMTNAVSNSIGSASFITMVKFVSAASCTAAEVKIEKIFQVMKPGALVLFIDNAGGGFSQLIEKVSRDNNFEMLMPPRRHVRYDEPDFKVIRFGYTSCGRSTVTILVLQKRLLLQHGNLHGPRKLPPQFHPLNNSVFPLKPINFNDHQSDFIAYKSPPIIHNLNQPSASCKSPTNDEYNSQLPNEPDSYSLKSQSITDSLNHQPPSSKSSARADSLNSPQLSKSDSNSHKSPSIEENVNREPVIYDFDSNSSKSPSIKENVTRQTGIHDFDSNSHTSPSIKENVTRQTGIHDFDSNSHTSPSIREHDSRQTGILDFDSNSHTSPSIRENVSRQTGIHDFDSNSHTSPSIKENVTRQPVIFDFGSVNPQNRVSTSQRYLSSSPQTLIPGPVGRGNTQLPSDRNGTSNDSDGGCCTCNILNTWSLDWLTKAMPLAGTY